MNWISYLLALGAGMANPTQSGANAELNKKLDDPIWTSLVIYLSGLLGILAMQMVARHVWPAMGKVPAVPWWAWLGGLVSIASTMAGLVYAQKMGSGVFTGLSVTAALTTSILLDHFGWMGFKTHPASPMRLAGAGLMIGGLWLIAKF